MSALAQLMGLSHVLQRENSIDMDVELASVKQWSHRSQLLPRGMHRGEHKCHAILGRELIANRFYSCVTWQRNYRATAFHHLERLSEYLPTNGIQHDIHTLDHLNKRLLRVIDHDIRTQMAHKIPVAG